MADKENKQHLTKASLLFQTTALQSATAAEEAQAAEDDG